MKVTSLSKLPEKVHNFTLKIYSFGSLILHALTKMVSNRFKLMLNRFYIDPNRFTIYILRT